jgi:hypothetical protein
LGTIPHWATEITREEYEKDNVAFGKYKDRHFRVDVEAADRWARSEKDRIERKVSGAKDRWKRQFEADDKGWAASFISKQYELRKDERIQIRKDVWERLGLLPLCQPYFKDSVGMLWDRLATRLAVAHLLSWESWNHRTRKEFENVKAALSSAKEEALPHESWLERLREYERERHEELKKIAFADDDNPFRVGKRAIRGWDRVLEQWQKNGKTKDDRTQILADLQTKLRGKFGDPALFTWLAEDGREELWQHVPQLVRLNALESLLRRKREYALMTFADAQYHPRWASYEAPGGTNLQNYELRQESGRVVLGLPLLTRNDNGTLEEKHFEIPLAPSGQLQGLEVENNGKKKEQKFCYRSSHQNFTGRPGGSEILFDRPFMENRFVEQLQDGNVGPVWFKLTLDIESQAPPEWLNSRGQVQTPPEVHHFKTALANKSKHIDRLQPGLRVLSVDLGLRTFASCSVFELVDRKPNEGLYFETDAISGGRPLYARHERSFMLRLPGEKVSRKAEAERRKTFDEIYSLKRDVGRLRDILRMGVVEDEEQRNEKLQALRESIQKAEKETALAEETLSVLDAHVGHAPELWKGKCKEVYDSVEKLVSNRFSEWRRRTRPRADSWEDWRERRAYHGGKWVWMLDYLDQVRKLLMSWSLRGREYGQINRLDRKERGTFAAGLLRHINNLKDDRIKSGADMIIQAARGYVPAGKGWAEKYEPCRVILFEDLARYRFRTDRPRRENSQLMKWNHREIIREVEMQAQLYGMVIETTAAGFSSRYHAATGAPGVRARRLMEDDFENGQPKDYLNRELDWMGSAHVLKTGQLVPWGGGELFVTANNGAPVVLHADLNAALNLQRRFWTRCGDAYRLPCLKAGIDGTDYWYPERDGVRLRGALAQLEDVGDNGYCRLDDNGGSSWSAKNITAAAWKKATGSRKKSGDETGEDELEEAVAMEIQTSNEQETFFHDPSGLMFDRGQWVPGKEYWGRVRSSVWNALMKQTVPHREPPEMTCETVDF